MDTITNESTTSTRLEISARSLELQTVLVRGGGRIFEMNCRIPLLTLRTNPTKNTFFGMN